MNSEWYYSRDGVVHGPYPLRELEDLARQKILRETDLVWQEGQGHLGADLARDMFAFPQAAATQTSLPDWLADVADAEPQPVGPYIATPTSAHLAAPEWIEDLRLWMGLEVYAQVKHAPPKREEIVLCAPMETTELPDWLEGLVPPERPKQKAVASAPPTGSSPVKPENRPVTPKSVPPAPTPGMGQASTIALATPVPAKPGMPVAPAVPATPAPAAPFAVPVLAKPVPAAPPATPIVQPVHDAAQTIAERLRDESGFDPETGQILDPIKFRKWTQQQAKSSATGQAGPTNGLILEVFRKGRLAIETWVDDDKNRATIMQVSIAELKRHADIQAILAEYGKYGKELQDKLLRHLEFMVENRVKYAKALQQR